MTLAVIYIESYSDMPKRRSISLADKERACRAYCERMGYTVYGRICHATTPWPEDVPPQFRVLLSPGRDLTLENAKAHFYYDHKSKHPYYVARNLLERGDVDVIVAFREKGPSGSVYEGVSEEAVRRLPRREYASLWEIEPPTPNERVLYELMCRAGEAGTKRERDMWAARAEEQFRRVQAERVGVELPRYPRVNGWPVV